MRVLILANNDGGLYHFRRMLIEKLLDNGNDVYISDPDGEFINCFTEIGCSFIDTPIDRRGINPVTDMGLIRKYFHIVKEIQPDLVITYTIKPNIYGGLVCRVKKAPYAVNITGLGTAFEKPSMLKKFVTTLYKVALKNAKVVFFENSDNRSTFLNSKICTESQSKLLNGAGVDLEHFKYVDYPEIEDPIRFLFIGRVMKEKGVDELFEAMKKLRNEGQNCVLDVVGEYEEDYSSVIEEYKYEGWLNYYGYQKDVRPFIEKAHCFVLPSWHEGMANTNLECAASGRPVITSDIPGCREAVIDGVSGFLCQPKNAGQLYEVMQRFLKLNKEQCVSIGKAGRNHMEQVFDKKKVVNETIKYMGS